MNNPFVAGEPGGQNCIDCAARPFGICAAVDKPVNVVMGLKGAPYSVDELGAAGVKRISVGGSFARAAMSAFIRAAKEVKEQGTFTYASDSIPVTAYMSDAKR